MDEDKDKIPDATETPPDDAGKGTEAPTDPDDAILARYGNDPKAVAKAYRNLQSTYTKVGERSKKVEAQLAAAGYTIGDDDIVYVPESATTSTAKKDEEAETDDELPPDPRVKALEVKVADFESLLGGLTASAGRKAKDDSFKLVAEDARPALEAAFDAQWRNLPVQLRTAETAEVIADQLAMRAIKAGKMAVTKGRSAGESDVLDALAGAADRTGGESRGASTPGSAQMRSVYDSLRLSESGLSFEDYCKQVGEAMR